MVCLMCVYFFIYNEVVITLSQGEKLIGYCALLLVQIYAAGLRKRFQLSFISERIISFKQIGFNVQVQHTFVKLTYT
jgi:hypothetical protein